MNLQKITSICCYLTCLLIAVVSRYNTNLKLYNIKVVENAFEVSFLLSSAVYTLCSLFSKQTCTRNISVPQQHNHRKMGNIRTRTEIVNPCIKNQRSILDVYGGAQLRLQGNFLEGSSNSSKMLATGWPTKKILGYVTAEKR